MSTGLIKVIKQASIDAMETGQPCDWRTGVVTSVSPLKVQITPQFILPSSVIVVPLRLKNDLNKGDKVALLRQKGGQSYLILDKI
jgi:hypothetical protein